MKVRVSIEGPDHIVIANDIIEVSTAALRGRPETEIEFIVNEYVRDWSRKFITIQWQIVDQSAFGLEYKPSEPRDD